MNRNRWNLIEKKRGNFKRSNGQKFEVAWTKDSVRPGQGVMNLDFKKSTAGGAWKFSVGNINTDCKFQQKYGWFEAKIQMARADAR